MPNSASISSMLGPTLGLILVYFIVLVGAYYFGARTAFAKAFLRTSTPPAIAAVVLFIGLYLIVVTISAQFAGDAHQFAYDVAVATFGLTLGWVLGIVISPSSKDEETEFSVLTKAVSTFLTGWVLANLKGITKDDLRTFLEQPQVPFRLLIGAASCLSSLAAVFVIRRAEVTMANAAREWFISYTPADPQHAQGLPGNVLARGPFRSRADALAEIERIKNLDEFKNITLTAVRVDIVSEQSAQEAATAPPTAGAEPSAKQEVPAATEQAPSQEDGTPKAQAAAAGAGSNATTTAAGDNPPPVPSTPSASDANSGGAPVADAETTFDNPPPNGAAAPQGDTEQQAATK